VEQDESETEKRNQTKTEIRNAYGNYSIPKEGTGRCRLCMSRTTLIRTKGFFQQYSVSAGKNLIIEQAPS